MSEKRFTIKPQDYYFGITDNTHADKMNVVNGIHTEIEAKWLCDLLNELEEKNQRLEKELTKKSIDYNGLGLEYEGLIAENKELKDFKQQVINLINAFIEDLKKTNEVSLFPKDPIIVLERLKQVIME